MRRFTRGYSASHGICTRLLSTRRCWHVRLRSSPSNSPRHFLVRCHAGRKHWLGKSVLRIGPFIARRDDRIRADEGSRQFDTVESVIHELIRLRSICGDRPVTLITSSGANRPGRADGIALGNDKPRYWKASEQWRKSKGFNPGAPAVFRWPGAFQNPNWYKIMCFCIFLGSCTVFVRVAARSDLKTNRPAVWRELGLPLHRRASNHCGASIRRRHLFLS